MRGWPGQLVSGHNRNNWQTAVYSLPAVELGPLGNRFIHKNPKETLMTLALYAATVPTFRQILSSVSGLLKSAEAFCEEQALPAEALLQARLVEDMFPFSKQVMMTTVHSIGAIEAVRSGVFSPDLSPPLGSFRELQDRVRDAQTALESLRVDDLDSLAGRPMRFEFGQIKMDYLVENFLLSFSQPNFYFHASTAYGILRMKGVPLGKRDFIGQPRIGLS